MGVYFPPSTGLDPSSASILHITRPRDSELAMLFAEHARWAQRETLKALRLAAADASQAVDSASRAAAGVSSALRQPGVEFPVYKEKALPGEPWFAGSQPQKWHGLLQGQPPGGTSLRDLALWFQKHPGPPDQEEVPKIDMGTPQKAGAARISDRGPAPAPFLVPPVWRHTRGDEGHDG
ncbi:unnamed protein product, partial [Prorocentrum cordatum]